MLLVFYFRTKYKTWMFVSSAKMLSFCSILSTRACFIQACEYYISISKKKINAKFFLFFFNIMLHCLLSRNNPPPSPQKISWSRWWGESLLLSTVKQKKNLKTHFIHQLFRIKFKINNYNRENRSGSRIWFKSDWKSQLNLKTVW